jgi:hypothetical protein
VSATLRSNSILLALPVANAHPPFLSFSDLLFHSIMTVKSSPISTDRLFRIITIWHIPLPERTPTARIKHPHLPLSLYCTAYSVTPNRASHELADPFRTHTQHVAHPHPASPSASSRCRHLQGLVQKAGMTPSSVRVIEIQHRLRIADVEGGRFKRQANNQPTTPHLGRLSRFTKITLTWFPTRDVRVQ